MPSDQTTTKTSQHTQDSWESQLQWPDLTFPPINLWVLQSAYNFYSTDTYNEYDTGEDDAYNQDS